MRFISIDTFSYNSLNAHKGGIGQGFEKNHIPILTKVSVLSEVVATVVKAVVVYVCFGSECQRKFE